MHWALANSPAVCWIITISFSGLTKRLILNKQLKIMKTDLTKWGHVGLRLKCLQCFYPQTHGKGNVKFTPLITRYVGLSSCIFAVHGLPAPGCWTTLQSLMQLLKTVVLPKWCLLYEPTRSDQRHMLSPTWHKNSVAACVCGVRAWKKRLVIDRQAVRIDVHLGVACEVKPAIAESPQIANRLHVGMVVITDNWAYTSDVSSLFSV